MFTVKWTLDDGSVRLDSLDSLACAMFAAIEVPPACAIYVEVTGPTGWARSYRLKGW